MTFAPVSRESRLKERRAEGRGHPDVALFSSADLLDLPPLIPARGSLSPGQDSLANSTNMFPVTRILGPTRREVCLRLAAGAGPLGRRGRHRQLQSSSSSAEVCLRARPGALASRRYRPSLLCAGAVRDARPAEASGSDIGGGKEGTPSPGAPRDRWVDGPACASPGAGSAPRSHRATPAPEGSGRRSARKHPGS